MDEVGLRGRVHTWGVARLKAVRESPAAGLGSVATASSHEERVRARQRALLRLAEIQSAHDGHARGGSLRASIFGVNDGLVSNASLVIGVAAANPGPSFVILAGVAGLVAGAFSMAAGEYISMKVQREVFESQIALERNELDERPDAEMEELQVIFEAKGVPPEDAARIAGHIMADPEVALALMAREELQLNPDDLGSPWRAAGGSFVAFCLGAVLPILPFIFATGYTALLVSLAVTGVALLTVGSFTARLTRRSLLFGGLRMLGIGGVATAVTYLVGRVVGVSTT